MKIQFRNVDKKFETIGFVKVREDEHGVRYERKNEAHDFTQVLAISYKESGKHIAQSYDKDLFDSKLIGNTCVGLTYYETKLVLKKMKQLGYHRSNKSVGRGKYGK